MRLPVPRVSASIAGVLITALVAALAALALFMASPAHAASATVGAVKELQLQPQIDSLKPARRCRSFRKLRSEFATLV